MNKNNKPNVLEYCGGNSDFNTMVSLSDLHLHFSNAYSLKFRMIMLCWYYYLELYILTALKTLHAVNSLEKFCDK